MNLDLLDPVFRIQLELQDVQSDLIPSLDKVFSAWESLPTSSPKVVIIGEVPYTEPNVASGIAFGTRTALPPSKYPPSLQIINQELRRDLKVGLVDSTLRSWAAQGVLLLNSSLTRDASGPHRRRGWERLIAHTLIALQEGPPHVYMLWGQAAQAFKFYIDIDKHLVLQSSSPQRTQAGNQFMGCGHFGRANKFLARHNQQPIQWGIEV